MQQSRLARARLADQGQHFTPLHVEIEVFEDYEVASTRKIGFGEPPGSDVGFRHLRHTITHCTRAKTTREPPKRDKFAVPHGCGFGGATSTCVAQARFSTRTGLGPASRRVSAG